MKKFSKALMLLASIPFTMYCGTLKGNTIDHNSNLSIKTGIYYGKEQSGKRVTKIPIRSYTVSKIKLFEQIISYRNNKKAYIDFTLPDSLIENTDEIEMVLEAYNDDDEYLRAIWFEVDGIGGYIGSVRVRTGQFRGNVTLGMKQKKQWTFNLSDIYTSSNNNVKRVNYFELLKKPGPHTISCWVSTYEKYGPQSWVSVELRLKQY